MCGSQYMVRDKPVILSQYKHRTGHMIIGIRYNNRILQKRVHRIVAEAFIPNPQKKPYVLHKDDDPENNCVSNLYWGDALQNYADRVRISGHGNEGGYHGYSHLTDGDVLQIKKLIYRSDLFYRQIGEKFSINEATVRAIKDGKSWKHVKILEEGQGVVPPKRERKLSRHSNAKKYRHKPTGKVFNSGKEAAIWAGINYATLINRVRIRPHKSEFEQI